jgi:hypothetical protein
VVADGHSKAFETAMKEVDEAFAARLRTAAVTGGVGIASFPFESHVCEPLRRTAGVLTERANKVLVGAAAGDTHEVVEHVIHGVVARSELISFVWEAHLGVRKLGVAATMFARRLFEEDDAGAGFMR